jgi:predicted Zn-dependent protease
MSKRVVNCGLALAVIAASITVTPAFAELSADQIQKRREVIHSCLLQIYLDRKQRPQALAEYATLVGYKPSDPKMRYAYGRYLANSGTPADIAGGITQMKKAVELDPGNFTYNGVLGAMYLKSKKPNEALPYLKLAVQYGGVDYKKTYEETFVYIESKKRADVVAKKNAEMKKAAAATAKAGGGADGAGGKKSDDDDDDW